jgi:Zn-dependent protease with chaperone function
VSLNPGSSPMFQMAQNALESAWMSIGQLFGQKDFSPEEALVNTPNIDPHFIPRTPMSNANLDTHTLFILGAKGYKRAKEVTAQTHPEFYALWKEMSARAGLKHPPQLMIAESKVVNAATISPEEVVVTTGLLKRLDLREAIAVLGHELGHATSNHTAPRLLALVGFGGAGILAGDRFAQAGGFGQFIKHDVQNPDFMRRAFTWLRRVSHSF